MELLLTKFSTSIESQIVRFRDNLFEVNGAFIYEVTKFWSNVNRSGLLLIRLLGNLSEEKI